MSEHSAFSTQHSAPRLRCQQRDEANRQCVLAVEHAGRVPCRFPGPRSTAEIVAALAPPELALQQRRRKMNKTEARYEQLLEGRRLAGELRRHDYEALTLRLAHDCRYTPDFFVIAADGRIELHEVKGAHIWEDSKIKIKVAAAQFPCFKFYLAKWEHGEWTIAEVKQ